MTVEELIEKLKQMPSTAMVVVEGENYQDLEPIRIEYNLGQVFIVTDEFADTSSEFLQQ